MIKWNISNLRKDSDHTSLCCCFHLILIIELSTSDLIKSYHEVPSVLQVNVREGDGRLRARRAWAGHPTFLLLQLIVSDKGLPSLSDRLEHS